MRALEAGAQSGLRARGPSREKQARVAREQPCRRLRSDVL